MNFLCSSLFHWVLLAGLSPQRGASSLWMEASSQGCYASHRRRRRIRETNWASSAALSGASYAVRERGRLSIPNSWRGCYARPSSDCADIHWTLSAATTISTTTTTTTTASGVLRAPAPDYLRTAATASPDSSAEICTAPSSLRSATAARTTTSAICAAGTKDCYSTSSSHSEDADAEP